MQRRQLLIGALALASVSHASAAGSKLHVTVVIRPHASVAVLHCAESLVVTQADVQRGWVASASPMLLAVRANHADGVAVELGLGLDSVVSAQVLGSALSATVGREGGRLLLPSSPGEQRLELDFRFGLGPLARPGRFAWPVRLSVAG